MKQYPHLWETLTIEEDRLESIRKDWSEGKVPDLPYAIIGQDDVKEHIKQKLDSIDGNRMETTILQAQYGDGKTNVLKYLELYFRQHEELGIRLIYCRANQDQTDLCMFLMQHIQASCFDELVAQVKLLASDPGFDPSLLVNNYEDDFAFIREYTQKLFSSENTDESITNLLYLGTGRLYSQAMFAKYDLVKLTDFNRREIFVLFMNILANAGRYVVFAVDELEKINDKSVKRMAHYFTSYRELLDLFNKINGHYLLTAITNGVDIAGLSQPFFERVRNDIVKIERIKEREDVESLIKLMANLLQKQLDQDVITKIWSKVNRVVNNPDISNNRRTIQLISESIKNIEYKLRTTVKEMLAQNKDLQDLYEETEQRINSEDGFVNLSRALFDPLEYYLMALGYSVNSKQNNYRRDYQAIYDADTNRTFFFLFDDDSKIKGRIEEFVQDKDIHDFVVFAKKELSISYAQLQIDNARIKLVDYDPKELFVLLNMYRWNFDKQKEISVLLDIATSKVFE